MGIPKLNRAKNDDILSSSFGEITDGVFLKGAIDKVSIDGIYPLSGELIIRSSAKGRLSLKM